MGVARALRRLGAELAIWFIGPAVFLAVYVSRYPVPGDAIAPHLYLVALLYLAVALARVVFARVIPSPAGARLASAVLVSAALATMLVYYGLVIVGLESWGRVISWDLITTYAAQWPALAATLGLAPALLFALPGAAFLGLLAAVWAYLGRRDWIGTGAGALSAPLAALMVACGGAVLAIETNRFAVAAWTHQAEPVSLTFFPAISTDAVQSHGIDSVRAQVLQRLEDAARAAYQPSAGAERRNVVLIVVDGLRPDHMGVYGYARDTTPNLSRLARSGVLRRAGPAYAACGESACGLISIGSSKYMRDFSNRPITLQEVLKRHGYRVHMILGGDHKNFYGLSQIYVEADSYYDGSSARGWYMNDDRLVLERVAALPDWDRTPVMIQLHLMSAHVLGTRQEAALKFLPAANYMVPVGRGGGSLDDSRRDGKTVNYYDNGVVQADAVIGELIDILRRKGYLEDTLVVVTADHGESLGENGHYGHQNILEGVLRVPLLLLSYGRQPGPAIDGARLPAQVDIAPTILAELGMAAPATWKGMALQRPAPRDFVYFQQQADVGLIDAREPGRLWKYWVNLKSGREYVFDLGADPGERRNLIGEVPAERRGDWRLRVTQGAAQTVLRPEPR